MELSHRDLKRIKKIILEAGASALRMQKGTLDVKRKDDRTIVTRADSMVQEIIVSGLSRYFKNSVFIYEENFDYTVNRLDPDGLNFIIDPIDGTAMYSMYLPLWCVSLGLFAGGTPVAGFVYSPASGMLFHNDSDSAYLNGRRLAADCNMIIDSESNLFNASEIHNFYRVEFPGKVRNLGSTALQSCLVADNARNRTAAFIGRSYLWDWAGAIPVIRKAGARLAYLSGGEPDFMEIAENGYLLPDFLVAYSLNDFGAVRGYFKKI